MKNGEVSKLFFYVFVSVIIKMCVVCVKAVTTSYAICHSPVCRVLRILQLFLLPPFLVRQNRQRLAVVQRKCNHICIRGYRTLLAVMLQLFLLALHRWICCLSSAACSALSLTMVLLMALQVKPQLQTGDSWLANSETVGGHYLCEGQERTNCFPVSPHIAKQF